MGTSLCPYARRLRDRTASTAAAQRYPERWDWEWARAKENQWAEPLLSTAAQVHEARRRGVCVGPARGSGEGCFLLFCLGANLLNPVTYEISGACFYGQKTWRPVSYFASEGRGPLLVAHWALGGTTPVVSPPAPAMPPWTFTHWPSWEEVLSRMGGQGLRDWATAIALARPGPAGSGLLAAFLAAPVRHRWTVFREKPPDVSSSARWKIYETYWAHALAEAFLYAWAHANDRIVEEVLGNDAPSVLGF